MDRTNKISDFLNEDFAYFLGLIVGRGTLIRGPVKRLIIDFPYKNIKAVGLENEIDTHLNLSNSLDKVVARLQRVGLAVRKENNEETRTVSIILEQHTPDTTWRFIKHLLNGNYSDYHSFRVPKAIFDADTEKQKEFLRGIFDVTGHVRLSNRDQAGNHRIYIEVDHRNWFLSLDLYKLFNGLGIRVQTINWGHPNFRDPKNTKSNQAWAKEHQFKIYANQFVSIGSYITHKQRVLEELAAENRPELGARPGHPRINEKPVHPDENSDRLPIYLRGHHFDHYLQLLEYLISIDSNG